MKIVTQLRKELLVALVNNHESDTAVAKALRAAVK